MLKSPKIEIDSRIVEEHSVAFLEEGCVVGHLNLSSDIIVESHLQRDLDAQYPEFDDDLSVYGVCDTPQQFMDQYREKLQKDERTFCVTFCHIQKNPNDKGKHHGWRWHKWGPYLGNGTPTTEYLDDEEHFQGGVYVYHIVQIDGPIFVKDRKTGKIGKRI